MKIAVFGCVHGLWDFMYDHVADADLVILTGDLHTHRDEEDRYTITRGKKRNEMGDFWKYYSGKAVAPVLTICIGGNNEAVGFLRELRYGGWIAPNIYFLGTSGVIRVGSLRIAGISGIQKPTAFTAPIEAPPLIKKKCASAYGVRKADIDMLMQVIEPVDIFISHDWPNGMEPYGDSPRIWAQKP